MKRPITDEVSAQQSLKAATLQANGLCVCTSLANLL